MGRRFDYSRPMGAVKVIIFGVFSKKGGIVDVRWRGRKVGGVWQPLPPHLELAQFREGVILCFKIPLVLSKGVKRFRISTTVLPEFRNEIPHFS